MPDATRAWVTNIQRYSVNDGYGIRTIVFLAGCSMRCVWCQNPETLGGGGPEVMFAAHACVGCGACAAVCPSGAAVLSPDDGAAGFDRKACLSCFKCVDECYYGARKRSAEEMTVDGAFVEVMKDEAFYRQSGGGLTMSGGEPLLRVDFCRELLRRVGDAGIHTAVETAGNVPRGAVAAVLPFTRLFLYDVKLFSEYRHRAYTGVSNSLVFANLEFLAASGVEVIVRVPLVPGVNDGAEFDAIVDRVAGYPALRELHILPYHTLGASKYEQLGLSYAAGNTPEENGEAVKRCAARAAEKGLRVSVGGGGFVGKTHRAG